MLWKGLEPFELRNTLTTDQLVEEFRSGEGRWLPPNPGAAIARITVYEVQALYRGILEDDQNSRFLEPYIRLETKIDTGSTNIVADFDCSLLGSTTQ